MKKFMMIALVMAGSAVMFSSCKKDYTCECKDSDGKQISASTYDKQKKSKAKKLCKAENLGMAFAGGSCKLK